VVRADFECLIPPHDQSCLLVFLVLEQSNVPGTSFFPFPSVSVELEKLRSHLEGLIFGLFVSFGLDFLGKVDDGLKMHIFGLLDFLVVSVQSAFGTIEM
jgi:hypothetical protein